MEANDGAAVTDPPRIDVKDEGEGEGEGDGALEKGMARSAIHVVNTPDTPDIGITSIVVKDEEGAILPAASNRPSLHATPMATANETPNTPSTDVTAVDEGEVVEDVVTDILPINHG